MDSITAVANRIMDLENENLLLKTIFNNSFEGIIIADESGLIIDWNSGSEKITGLSKASVIGEYIWKVQYKLAIPELRKATSETAHESLWNTKVLCLQNGETIRGVGKIQTYGREIKYVEDLISPIIINDNRFFCVFQRDITDREKAAHIIEKQNDELIKLNTDKDRFMSILAHDLKSPFHSILGLLDLLAENINSFDTKEITDIINQVNNSAHKTFNLLDDLLLWINARSGKLVFDPQELNFSEIFNDIKRDLDSLARNKNIQIIELVSFDTFILADKNILKTVLRNLISNAIKFTDQNGLITINAESDSEFVTVLVSDTGIGIEQIDLVRLFDTHRRISTPGTRNETGTGLGLLLCKEFIDRLGGRIWAESEPGKGSKFSFTVPYIKN